jgi:hypothetical protein
MPAAPTVSDLATWLGQTIADDDARALLVVTSANGLVLDASPGSPAWDATWPQVAHTIAVGAAARGWTNPVGASEQRTGPFSATVGGVMLTDEEKETLSGLGLPVSGGVPGLSSVRVVAPANTSPSGLGWVDLQQYDGDDE